MARRAPLDDRSNQPRPPESAVSLEQLHQQLTEAIAKIETGEQWRAWLDFAQRLHQYSFNNLILISAQRPEATAVASYRTWQATNRQVRRGEKALRVIAPILRRTPELDANGRPVLGSDGRPVQRQRITGYRAVPVFDIAQTEGPPLPQAPRPALLAGEAPAGLWESLTDGVIRRGYRLLRGPREALGGANGVTKISLREVWVRDDVDDAQAVKTLTHELAHIILHTPSDEPAHCAGVREVEAESVAHLVLATHGVETGDYSFPYVATWAHPLAAVEHVPIIDIVARTGTRVVQAAAQIIDVTAAALDAKPDPATEALAARVAAAAERTGDLHERVAASLLPPVERATLLGVIADSHDFYRRQAAGSWVPTYLGGRGLAAAITSHHLGYAPKSWTAVTDHLRNLGYTDDHIEASGMATRARTGRLIDRFRDRLTIPLHDRDGDLIGFTARSAPDAGDHAGPKYLNSPATAIFRKSEVLYRLGEFRNLNNESLPVICEGPLDAVAVDLIAAQRGLPVAGIASVGTAFTEQHARQLFAATSGRPILLAFDGDSAGQGATERAWRQLTDNQPYDIRVVQLPDRTDPASLASTDPENLATLLQRARPAAAVIALRQIDAARLDDHAGRQYEAFRLLSKLTGRIPTDQRTAFLLELVKRLDIDPGDAAAMAVEQNPAILMERVIGRAQQLDFALRDGVAERRAAVELNPPYAEDHLARVAIRR